MHRLIPFVTVTLALVLAGTAHAASPDAVAPAQTRAAAEVSVLECHAQYAHRYAMRVEAVPSEIAAGAFAACKLPMDAFEALAPKLAKEDARVAIGVGDAHAAEREIVTRFRENVRNATIDAVIRARAAP